MTGDPQEAPGEEEGFLGAVPLPRAGHRPRDGGDRAGARAGEFRTFV